MGPGILGILALMGELTPILVNAIMQLQGYQDLIETARSEGRDVSDEELAALKAQSDALTQQVLDTLQGN